MKRILRISRKFILGIFCLFSNHAIAQYNKYSAHGWQLLDYRTDSVYGAGVSRAYNELVKGRKAMPVIVAVIDTGLDTAQEDLSGHIWTNKKEIPNNGIDDDQNGYTDDVHGWNFLGSKEKNLSIESYESSREFFRLTQRTSSLSKTDSAYNNKVRKYYIKDSLQQAWAVTMLDQVIPQMRSADSLLQSTLHKDSIYAKDVINFRPADSLFIAVRNNTIMYFRKYGITPDMSLGRFIQEADQYLINSKLKLKNYSVDPNQARKQIVGDDYNNLNDRNYGNNNISAGFTSHGTHVAGIITAIRNNGKGMDGIDENVFIMPLRAVPDGDERDKDVALAIRYAVDNGALVINMSFGKYFSPQKKWVDEAMRYAEQHDVLLVHAAGNESQNLDSVMHFPNPDYEVSGKDDCCYLTVGSSSGGPDSIVLARSSNFGKTKVDLFAPGVKVFSTLPNNQYASYSGTSMAAPVVSGIAAMLLGYYPQLSAAQLKYVLMKSVMLLPGCQVLSPANHKMVGFEEMSVSGGIVNAYNALLLAGTLKGDRKSQN